MRIPVGHFDTSTQDPNEIADVLLDRIERLMDAEGEALLPGEAKHASHDQSSHGNWANACPACLGGRIDLGGKTVKCRVCGGSEELGGMAKLRAKPGREFAHILAGDLEEGDTLLGGAQVVSIRRTRGRKTKNHPKGTPRLRLETRKPRGDGWGETVVDETLGPDDVLVVEHETEAKHGNHDQSSHGNWAREVLDSISDAAVSDPSIPFEGFDVEKAVGLPKVSREVGSRASKHAREHYVLPPMFLWDAEGNRSPNPDYYPAVEEHYDKVPFGLLQEFRDKVHADQAQVSRPGVEKYLSSLETETPAPPLLSWDPETDTYVIDDGYHRMVAMLAGGMSMFEVYVPKESPWARAMRGDAG